MSVDWDFLEGGYFEEKDGRQVVRADLMATHARAFGSFFANSGKPTSAQLRNFHNDAKALESKLRQGGSRTTQQAYDEYEHLIKMLNAKVAYAYGRDPGKYVSKEFRDFIHKCVEAIKGPSDFEAFMKFLEGTVGFYYGRQGEIKEEKRKRRRR